MSTISITKLYESLAIKLGKETAENLTTFIDNKINQGLENKTETFATKGDIAELKIELKAEISETKFQLLKWMFIFWVSQAAVTFSFILLFLKK